MSQVMSGATRKTARTQPTEIKQRTPFSKGVNIAEQMQTAVQCGPSRDPEERYRMIAEAAYFKSAQRDFAGGRELDDWLEAEVEIERRHHKT